MAQIELLGLSRTYRTGAADILALQAVDLSLEAGSFIAIMGPSGSGKSTLLNLLGLLDHPTSGQYLLDGRDVSVLDDDEVSEIRCRKIGMVFQSFNLFQHFNVIENVCVPMHYAEVNESAMRARARELLDRVGLSERLSHRPTQLSGGQCQRVAIARALANDPLLILADEPTGNLDEKTGREIVTVFQQLRDEGRVIVMVTHNQSYVHDVDRVVTLHDGRISGDTAATVAAQEGARP